MKNQFKMKTHKCKKLQKILMMKNEKCLVNN